LPVTTEADPTRTREREILTVASAHLNTMGVSAEWFAAIADTLGVTRPALYKYAADREDLQYRCYRLTCDELQARFETAQAASSDSIDVLTGFLGRNLEGGPELAVMSELFALREHQRRDVEARQEGLVAMIAATVRAGQTEGRIRAGVEADLLARTLLGLISWPALLARWGAAYDPAHLEKGLLEILLHGLAAGADGFAESAAPLAAMRRPRLDVFSRSDLNAAKREIILIAASSLFNRRGIGATRIDDVADALQLSKRAVYHHVGQKQDLVDACVERSYQHALAVMAAADALAGSRMAALTASIRDVIVASSDPDVCVMVPYVGYGQVSPGQRAAVAAHVAAMAAGYRRLLETGVAEGSIRHVDLDAAQVAIPGFFCWTANTGTIDAGAIERRAAAIADLIARGILP
jgi:AcrR family transcriptional regulator